MMMSRRMKNNAYLLGYGIIVVFFLFVPQVRANPGIAPFLIFVGTILYWGIFKLVAYSRSRQCTEIIEDLSQEDKIWDINRIHNRIKDILHSLASAKVKRNPMHAKHCMDKRYYERFKRFIETMINEDQTKIVESIEILEVKPIELEDYLDNTKDRLSVCVIYEAIDYMIDSNTGLLVSGDCNKPERFTELWKLKRTKRSWVLEQIESDVKIIDLLSSLNSVEVEDVK